MLSAVPRSWHSWDFKVEGPDGHVADLGVSWRERGEIVVEGSEYTVRREGWRGPFLLAGEGSVFARARKTGFFRKEFEIEFEGGHYTLAARSCWGRSLVLRQGGEELGAIRPQAWYKRSADIELAERLSPLLQAFVVWLGLLLWKRDADAAASGA